MPLDAAAVGRWFEEYFDLFGACARGDREMSALLGSYSVPMIVTSDAGAISLMTDDEAAAVIESQIDALRAQGYHHTTVLHSEVTLLNSTSALYRCTLSRRNAGGTEIGCPAITYVVTEDVAGPRIVLLAAQGQ